MMKKGQVFYANDAIPDGCAAKAGKPFASTSCPDPHGLFYKGDWIRNAGEAIYSCDDGLRPAISKQEAADKESLHERRPGQIIARRCGKEGQRKSKGALLLLIQIPSGKFFSCSVPFGAKRPCMGWMKFSGRQTFPQGRDIPFLRRFGRSGRRPVKPRAACAAAWTGRSREGPG